MSSGLWFGTLGPSGASGSSAKPADFQVDEAVVPATINQGAAYAFCPENQGTSLSAYIHLHNSGEATTTVKSLTLDYNGTTIPVTLSGSCAISPGDGLYLVILSLPFQPNAGASYTGHVSFADGVQVSFEGSFA